MRDYLKLYQRYVKGLKRHGPGSEWAGYCPFPKCNGKSQPKFYVNGETGQYNCRRCGAKGNAITFAKYFHENPQPYYDTTIGGGAGPTTPEIEKLPRFQIALLENRKSWPSPWKPNTVQALGIGLDGQTFVFPVFDQAGETRSLIWHKKRQTKGARVSLYPAHVLRCFDPSYLIICEGLGDCVSLLSVNIQTVTSTGGALSIPKDISVLRRFERIYLCLDNDEAGDQGTGGWINRLHSEFSEVEVRVCDLSPHVDERGDVTSYLSLPDKNRDAFISEVLKRARVGRPFSDEPDFVRQTMLSDRFTSLHHRDRLVYWTLVSRVTRYRLRTAEINGLRVLLRPGEYVTSYQKLAELCPPFTRKEMITSLRRLDDAGYIRMRDLRERRGQVMTLAGWEDGHTDGHTKTVKRGTPSFPLFSSETLLDIPQDGHTDFPGLGTDVGQVNSYNSGERSYQSKGDHQSRETLKADRSSEAREGKEEVEREPVRRAELRTAPRSNLVRCGDCRHIIRDPVNPAQGWADCRVVGPATWPMTPHFCAKFEPVPKQESVEV